MSEVCGGIVWELMKKIKKSSGLSQKMDHVIDLIEGNQESLHQLETISRQLNVLDSMFVKIDQIAGDTKSYREQQELNSNTLTEHTERIENVERHLGMKPILQ
jgi:hypothetical protein